MDSQAQTLAFLAVEAVYIALHVKPLAPLISGQQQDSDERHGFLRTFTVASYFASELALFWLLAYASPIRWAAGAVLARSLQEQADAALLHCIHC